MADKYLSGPSHSFMERWSKIAILDFLRSLACALYRYIIIEFRGG